MTDPFEWDKEKAISNLKKHGVSFEEAATVFSDPLSSTIPDPRHSQDEERHIIIGLSILGRHLVVVHTDRGDKIRVIGARRATPGEIRNYERENR